MFNQIYFSSTIRFLIIFWPLEIYSELCEWVKLNTIMINMLLVKRQKYATKCFVTTDSDAFELHR